MVIQYRCEGRDIVDMLSNTPVEVKAYRLGKTLSYVEAKGHVDKLVKMITHVEGDTFYATD